MCRWLAYSGAPLFLEDLITRPRHSLIDQSFAARSSSWSTNGDGFGLAWYGRRETPGLYRSIRPAWNDRNLRHLAAHIESPLFLAHVRATTGTAVQESNCHPFVHGRWIFAHNGLVKDFPRIHRRLAVALSEDLFPCLEGTTDSELLFHLALGFGLEDDPLGALARMVGFVEVCAEARGISEPLLMTLGVSDGRRLIAVRYASGGEAPSLYRSRGCAPLCAIHPEGEGRFAEGCTVVVSEPLTDLADGWEEIPDSSVLMVEQGEARIFPFQPLRPSSAAR